MSTQLVSFSRPKRDVFEQIPAMTDPGVHAAVADEISERVPTGARVLDVGAGAGAFSLRLHRAGYRVDAVDVDDARFHLPDVRFRKIRPEDKLSEVYGREQFGAVAAIEVIEHVSSTHDFLREAARVLIPGGLLFVTTPNLCSFYSRIVFLKEGRFFHFQGPESWRMGHINPVPYFVIEQFAPEVGLRLVTRQGAGHMPVLDWSKFRLRSLLTALPRLFFYLCMRGPGPKDGNSLLYCFRKEDAATAASPCQEGPHR